MTAFYDDMRDVSAELIAEFGQALILTSVTPGAYNTATGAATAATTTQTAVAIEQAYTAREIDGALVRAGDRRLMVSPVNASGSALTAPTVRDCVAIGGESYAVVSCEPYAPGGTILYYILQSRKT